MSNASVTVAVLAGGQGRRLGGVDKGLHLLHGTPLIAHVVESLEAMLSPNGGHRELDVLILANRNLDMYSRYARSLPDAVDSGEGPLAGVATALSAITTPWLLTVPVDCPNPPSDLWQRLHSEIGDADCAVAHDGSHRQPLFALYRTVLAQSALKAAQAAWGPRTWQDHIAAVEVDFPDRRDNFANLNSDADFLASQGVDDD